MLKTKQKLNILMPSYNKEQYIREAIDSVMAQKTNFDYTLIITDDGSTDRTIDIVKEYQEKYGDKIILLPSKKNQRLLANIIKAYKEMNCEYFACLDADDYLIDENFYQKAIDFLDKNQDFSIYASNTYAKYPNGEEYINHHDRKIIESTFDDFLNDKAVLGNTISSVFRNKCINEGLIKILETKIGDSYTEHSFREDDFRNRIHLANGKAHFVDEAVGIYRSTDTGLYQGSNKLKKFNLMCRAYIDMYEFFGKNDIRWIDLAVNRFHRLNSILSYDLTNIKQYNNNDILQTFKIFYLINKYSPEKALEELNYLKQEKELKKIKKLKYKIFYAVYKYLRKKLQRKGIL